jgi:hypothetical protein
VKNALTANLKKDEVEDPKKDIATQFNSRIDKALDWYKALLEEYKNSEIKTDENFPQDENESEGRQKSTSAAVEMLSINDPKLLSSKDVAEAMAKCVKMPQDQQEGFVSELESTMDLSDFSHESEWTIDITEEAHKWFRKHIKRQYYFCERIIRRLKLLSTGRWPYVLCKPLKTKKSNIKLYEAKIDTGSRIIWEVAISFSPRRSSADHTYCEQ